MWGRVVPYLPRRAAATGLCPAGAGHGSESLRGHAPTLRVYIRPIVVTVARA